MTRGLLPRRAAIAAVLATAALAGAWAGWRAWRPPAPVPAWPDPPVLRLEPGAERAYEVELRSEAWLASGGEGGARTRSALVARGLLVLRPYPGRDELVEVGARLVGARLTVDGRPPGWATALDAPFSFHLDRQGRFTALAFPPGLPREAATLLEQVLVRVELVLPRQRRASWRTRERDAAGIYRADHRVDPAAPLRIEKRKLEYLPAEGGHPPPQVVESLGHYTLEPGLAGVRSVEGAERLRRRDGGLAAGESVTFRYERTAAPGALPATAEELHAALLRRRDGAPPAAAATAAAPRDVPAPGAAEAALRRFGEAFGRDRPAAEALAIAWLRQPGAPGALVARLDEAARHPDAWPLDPARRAVLWRLLAQAGTPDAEAALLDAALSAAHPLLSRRQAVGHMGQVIAARPAMVEGMLGLYDAAGDDGDGLGAMALLSAGALGDPSLAGPELSRSVAAALEERLVRAADPAEREAVLAAMGNAGEPCLPALRAALADPDPAQRAAAVSAFRRMDGPEGRRALLDHAAAEPDPAVRARAVEVLQRLGPDREVIAWAARDAAGEPDREVLLALVDLLGRAGDRSPEARAALEALRRGVNDRAVELRLLRYLPP